MRHALALATGLALLALPLAAGAQTAPAKTAASAPITAGPSQRWSGRGRTKSVSMSAYIPPSRASTSRRTTSAWWA